MHPATTRGAAHAAAAAPPAPESTVRMYCLKHLITGIRDVNGADYSEAFGVHTTTSAADRLVVEICNSALRAGMVGIDLLQVQLVSPRTPEIWEATAELGEGGSFIIRTWTNDGQPAREFGAKVSWVARGRALQGSPR